MRLLGSIVIFLFLFSIPLHGQSNPRKTWDSKRLNEEIDKGKNDYDLAKLIRYMDKIESGQVMSDDEVQALKKIAYREAPREMGVDETLYGAVFASYLIRRYDQKQTEVHDKLEAQRAYRELERRIDELKTQVDQLKAIAATNGKPKTTPSP